MRNMTMLKQRKHCTETSSVPDARQADVLDQLIN